MTLSTNDFLERLSESGILPEEMKRRVAETSANADPRTVAEALVSQGIATRFQVNALLEETPRPVLLGEYVLLDELGAGAMGIVYKARHRRMDRVVAVKVLARDLTGSEEAVQRFYREVRAIGKLHHPNIVLAHDASEHAGEHYLVMELIEGTDVGEILRDHGALPLGTALRIVGQAAAGLVAAHANGIVHRDVKPANLFLTTDGTVKVLDLGIARLRDAEAASAEPTLTQTGLMLGTVAYMAPEHAANPREADERSDVYSLGCTLYRILTNRLPYTGTSAVDLLFAARDSPIPDLREHFPAQYRAGAYLGRVQALFERLAAKSPADRPRTMVEVESAIQELLADLPPELENVRAIEDEAQPSPTPAPAAGGAAATVVRKRPKPAPALGDVPTARDPTPTGPGLSTTTGAPPKRPSLPSRVDPNISTVGGRTRMQPVARRPVSEATASGRSGRGAWLLAALVVIVLAGALGASWLGRRSADAEPSPTVPDTNTVQTAVADATPDAPQPPSAAVRASLAPTPPPVLEAQDDEAPGVDLVSAEGGALLRTPLGSWRREDGALISAGPASTAGTVGVTPGHRTRISLRFDEPPKVPAAGVTAGDDAALRTVTAALTLLLPTTDGGWLAVELDRPRAPGAPGAPGALESRIVPLATLSDVPGARDKALAVVDGRVLPETGNALVEAEIHPWAVIVRVGGRTVLHGPRDAEVPGRPVAPTPRELGFVAAGPITLSSWRHAPLLHREAAGGERSGGRLSIAGVPLDGSSTTQTQPSPSYGGTPLPPQGGYPPPRREDERRPPPRQRPERP